MEGTLRKGRGSQDHPPTVKKILLEHQDRIICARTNTLLPATNPIWAELKEKYEIRKSSRALHTFVACNRCGIKDDLKINQHISYQLTELEGPKEIYPENMEKSESEDDWNEDPENPYDMKFQFHIPNEKWNMMAPEEQRFRRRTTQKGCRSVLALKKGIWTDIMSSMIYKEQKLPCCWAFKGAFVGKSGSGRNFIKIRGYCGCGSRLIAICANPSFEAHNRGVDFEVKIWNDGSLKDHSNLRRRLSGNRRQQLVEEMVKERKSATKLRKEMASKEMDVYDPYPCHIPSNEVMRKAKSNYIQEKRLNQDPIVGLQLMKHSHKYLSSIQDLGMDPFFLHFTTPDQMRIYNAFNKRAYCRLVLDATGGVVEKLHRPGGESSKHIYLYSGVVSIPGSGEGQVPVVQMLSERQNTAAITYWLQDWRRRGATVPNEVVCDNSAALLSAICRALADESSTLSYVNNCLKFLQTGEHQPKTLIRLDIAHLTKMLRQWKEISALKPRPKEFFVRAIILVAKSDSLLEARHLLLCLFVTSSSEFEGLSLSTGEQTPCEIRKRYLLSLISGVETQTISEEEIGTVDEGIADEEGLYEEIECVEQDIVVQNVNADIKNWVEQIVEECKREIEGHDDGNRDNIMYEPSVMKRIVHFANLLPIWCYALASKCNSPYVRGVGASVESEFNNLKNRLICGKRRVDDFTSSYLDLIDGTIKIASTLPIFRANQAEPSEVRTQTLMQINADEVCTQTLPREDEVFSEDEVCTQILPIADAVATKECVPSLACQACQDGNFPTGAHKCRNCGRFVHIFEGCSIMIEGNEEGYGEERICIRCNEAQPSLSLELPPSKQSKSPAPQSIKEYIESFRDHSYSADSNEQNELNIIENWRGLSEKPKKIKTPYYWTDNPDFPHLDSCQKTKIGVMKNGGLMLAKAQSVEGKKISLKHTCSFDSPLQIMAAACCDSATYKSYINSKNVTDTMLDLAIHLATKGVQASSYQKRAKILSSKLEGTLLKSDLTLIDCGMDSSMLTKKVMHPSVQMDSVCSSEFCPDKTEKKTLVVLSADMSKLGSIGYLQERIDEEGQQRESFCLKPFKTSCENIPPEHVIRDITISKTSPLCAGQRTMCNIEWEPHILFEVVSAEERQFSGTTSTSQHGVYKEYKCVLEDIPKTLQVRYGETNTYKLRGIVHFFPPPQDSGIGHYVAYCLRPDLTWELYDDLKDKSQVVSKETRVNLHVAIYTL